MSVRQSNMFYYKSILFLLFCTTTVWTKHRLIERIAPLLQLNETSFGHSWSLNLQLERVAEYLNSAALVSNTCREDLAFTLNAINGKDNAANSTDLQKRFVLPLLDSWAKLPPSGVLRGNLKVLGQYLECVNINYYSPELQRNIEGEYYRIFYSGSFKPYTAPGACGLTFTFDVCLPKSCAEQNLAPVFQAGNNKSIICHVASTNQNVQKADAGTWIIGSIIALLTAASLLSSILDYYVPEEQGKQLGLAYGLITAFSFHRNVRDVFTVKQINKQTGCLNCIRFFSSCWVIAGHTMISYATLTSNPLDFVKYARTVGTNFYLNAFFSVDTFFFLSGFLVAFSWFKIVNKNRAIVTSPGGWIMFYVHRILRLSPPYFLVVFATGWLIPVLYQNMPLMIKPVLQSDMCQQNWWTNVLYVNNLVNFKENCVPVSWYLAVDMQFYIFSPILLLAFAFFGALGGVILTVLLCGVSFLWTFIVVYHLDLPPTLTEGPFSKTMDYMLYVYNNPLARLQPYVIGMVVGYMVQNKRHLRIPKILNIALWILTIAGMVGLVLSAYSWNQGDHHLTNFGSACYNAFSRTGWSLCMAWVIIASYYQMAGPIGDFMNWEIWYPLGRLSFAAYLVHFPLLEFTMGLGNDHYQFRSGWDSFINHVCPIFLYVYIFSVWFSAMCERPFVKLESLLFARAPRRKVEPIAPIAPELPEKSWPQIDEVREEKADSVVLKL